jgi:hypothetical protein
MTMVSRKYRSNKKISRKRNSKKRLSNKQYGGKPDYSPEATSDVDKRTEDYMTEILVSAKENAPHFENSSTYKQYWLGQVIPSIEEYVEEQKQQLTQDYYREILTAIENVKIYIETSSDFVPGEEND